MFTKPIDAIEASDLQRLVSDRVMEGVELDYKDELPGRNDAARKEFAADICSFANARGGYIVYGAQAERDSSGKATGAASALVGFIGSADSEVLRLDSMARDMVDPRVPGLAVRAVQGVGQGFAILIHVPRSWAGPHMVCTGDSRFYSRGSAGKFPMDVTQIRVAFESRTGVARRATAFRDERIGRIIAGDMPVLLQPGPIVSLHVIPLASMESTSVDLTRWEQGYVPPLGATGSNPRYNVDGLLACHHIPGVKETGYTQVFRNGALEGAATVHLFESRGRTSFHPQHVEHLIYEGTTEYLRIVKKLGPEGPLVVFASFLLGRGLVPNAHTIEPISRDVLVLPDIYMEDAAQSLDANGILDPAVLRPACDAFWQACGQRRSPSLDERGRR